MPGDSLGAEHIWEELIYFYLLLLFFYHQQWSLQSKRKRGPPETTQGCGTTRQHLEVARLGACYSVDRDWELAWGPEPLFSQLSTGLQASRWIHGVTVCLAQQ